MIIEQDQDQINDAIQFHTRAEISFLRLARARIWSRQRITQPGIGREINFDINFKPGLFSVEEPSLFIETDFVFAMNESKKENPNDREPLIVVDCCFEAEYRFAQDYKPTEKQIDAFRSANAVFNCWPFFREFVQTSIARMHYPPPPVPFLRLTLKG
jgi:hypothetical protein